VSFILEALRKSESERQRLGNTAIAELPVARRPRGQPWWVFGIGALLLINLVVLALVLLKKDAPVEIAATPAAPPAPVAAPPVATAPNVLAQEAATAPQVEYETVPRSEMELAAAAASVPDGPTLVRPIENSSNIPAVSSLPDAGGEMRMDLHVFASNPADRFVLINMRRYTEGQRLPSGATVEQINPAGVIIYANGGRYQLNRQ
jgi:general secretion pathway protein B